MTAQKTLIGNVRGLQGQPGPPGAPGTPGRDAVVDSYLSETSTNAVQNAAVTRKLNEVFQSVSSGKAQIASAITDKGISTDAEASFETMAENIRRIQTGSGKVNVDNFYNLKIGVIYEGTGDVNNSTSARAYTEEYFYIKTGQTITMYVSETCENPTDSFYAFYYGKDKIYNQAASEKYYNAEWSVITEGAGTFTPEDEGYFRFVFRNQNRSNYTPSGDNLKIAIQ